MALTKPRIQQIKDLTAGDFGKLLQVNSSGAWVADYISNTILPVGVVGLNKINQGGALTGNYLYWNGSTWTPKAKSEDVTTGSLGTNQVDNLGLTNLNNNDIYVMSADDVTPAYITGINATSVPVGKVVKLHYGYVANQAQNPAFFLTGDTPSTAANRINNAQWSIIPLMRGGTLELFYSSSRWNVLSAPTLEGIGIYSYNYSPTINILDSDTSITTLNGTADLVLPETGVGTASFKLTTSENATGQSAVYFYGPIQADGGIIKAGEGSYLVRATVYVPTASDGTDNFELSLYLSPIDQLNTPITNHTHSYSIRHLFGTNSSKFTLYTRVVSFVSESSSNTITMSSDKVYTFEMLVLPSRAVVGYVNGVYLGAITTNLPAAGTNLAPAIKMRRTAGTASRSVNVTSLTVHSLQTPTL